MNLIIYPTNKVVAENLELIRYETEFEFLTFQDYRWLPGVTHKITLADFKEIKVDYLNNEINAVLLLEGKEIDVSLNFKSSADDKKNKTHRFLRHIEVTYNKGPNNFIYQKVGNSELKRRIVSAAISIEDVDKTLVIPSVRHYDLLAGNILDAIYTTERWLELKKDERVKQGFVDNTGKFWQRADALTIALASEQVKRKHPSIDELYSEDLY